MLYTYILVLKTFFFTFSVQAERVCCWLRAMAIARTQSVKRIDDRNKHDEFEEKNGLFPLVLRAQLSLIYFYS